MKRFLLLTIILNISLGAAYGGTISEGVIRAKFFPQEIKEIYIESNGNNKYESKIKAHEQGMRRALAIVADREGVAYENIKKIPYFKLKEVFVPTYAAKVIETEETYCALVNYKYKLYDLNNLLYEYGDKKVTDRFYEYIIFPVFKQRKTLNLWDTNSDWIKRWSLKRGELNNYKLFYPPFSKKFIRNVTSESVFRLKFDELQEIFHSTLFKKGLVIVAEFFTNQHNGSTILSLQYVVIQHRRINNIISREYPVNSVEDIPRMYDQIILDTEKEFGITPKKTLDQLEIALRENQNENKDLYANDYKTLDLENEQRLVQLNVDIYSSGELSEIEHKLSKVNQIDKYSIHDNQDGKYKIAIWTKKTDYELAEGFYVNGLSFKIYGNMYNLIDIKEGG